MATLNGRTVSASYTELLKTSSGGGVSSSLDTVEDGDATPSALQISSAGVKSAGTLETVGDTTLGANLTLGGATVAGIKDEDAMTSDSPTHLVTQQSVKAYVDSQSHAGEANTGSNTGSTGEGVFKAKTGIDLEFKKLVAGSNVTITGGTDAITIASTGGGGGGGSGETNTSSNVGTSGVGVFKQKTGVDFEFKKINAGSSKVTITDDTSDNEIDIDVAQGNIDHNSLSNYSADQHRTIDDSATGVTDLWSADKINSQLGGKAASVHTHSAADVNSGTFPTARIADDAITYAKIQNVSATDKILGRSTAGAGVTEEIDCTSAGRALLDDADASAQRTTLGLAIGTDVQAYDATIVVDADIGSTVQAHDADTAKTDVAQSFTAPQRGSVDSTQASAGTCDLSEANNHAVAVSGTTTLSVSNATAGQAGVITITHDGSAVSFSGFKFAGGTTPTPGTSGVDVLAYYCESASRISAVYHVGMA
jgi:hypothetical protein